MAWGDESSDHIRSWIRNRNTVKFLGLWKSLNNANFKPIEFKTFRKQTGPSSFNLNTKKWIEATNAIGISSINKTAIKIII